MGTIYKRGRIWWIKYYRHGKAVYESSASDRRDHARTLLRQREGDLARFTRSGSGPKIGILLADVVADYRTNQRSSLKDVFRYVERLTAPNAFGGRRAAHVTAAELQHYIAARQEQNAADATINRELATLARAYSLAIRAGSLIARPHIPRLREDNARHGFFEAHQVQTLLEHLPAYARGPVRFMHTTGWRKGVVLGLLWPDVTDAGIRVPAQRTKNPQPLLFPWTGELHAIVEAQRAETDRVEREHGVTVPWLFHNDGQRIGDFRRSWVAACRSAGCPGMLCHDFRRTAARNLVRAGIPERVVMDLVGWKTRAMLDRYHIVSPGDLRAAAQRIDAG